MSTQPEPALVDALAYALARAPFPGATDTSRDYAERLAPLVIESGWLPTAAARAEVARRAAAELTAFADTHAAMRAGHGNTDDLHAFAGWLRRELAGEDAAPRQPEPETGR